MRAERASACKEFPWDRFILDAGTLNSNVSEPEKLEACSVEGMDAAGILHPFQFGLIPS